MIFDSISNSRSYEQALPELAAAFRYLAETDFSATADGTYPLGGDGFRAIVQSYESKAPEAARLEAHRRFIDVQYIVSGEERIGCAPLARAGAPLAPFDDAKDIVFLDGAFEPVTLRAGDFALFFPQDAHAPGIRAGGSPAHVRKVVIKIPVHFQGTIDR